MNNEKIIILDFGSQFTQVIARRIRDLGVYCEILPCTVPYNGEQCKGLVLSGGPASVTAADAPKFDEKWLKIETPILGICYGMQLLANTLGGKISKGHSREYGRSQISIKSKTPLFNGFQTEELHTVWMSHGDHVSKLPEGFKLLAESESGGIIAGMANEAKNIFAIQFHPEVVHTIRGREIISNFLFKICECRGDWKPSNFITATCAEIRNSVSKDAKVVCALSGGVDSTVAAVLVNKALSGNLQCIFVDNGLLRKDEGDRVEKMLGSSGLGLKIERANEQKRFLDALKGVTDPEQKRKIIGRLFIEIFEEKAKKIGNVTHLVQGTLYPDVIESVSFKGPSDVIKSHHNVGGLPERMNLKLIEPLRELFKDEVRKIGLELGIQSDIINRQPFPGPGLAIRIVGEITEEKIKKLQLADEIYVSEIKAAGLYEKLWQSFAALIPVKSVGVMGDCRTYDETISLRAVASDDGMTADWVYLPEDLLKRVSSRIINEVKGINRVLFDISSKPPATIEWE